MRPPGGAICPACAIYATVLYVMLRMRLDPIDYRILDLLQRDARTTQVQIASAVKLAQPSVADRIKKLDQSGAVLGYVARRDPRKGGNDIRAFVGLPAAHPPHHHPFHRRVPQS